MVHEPRKLPFIFPDDLGISMDFDERVIEIHRQPLPIGPCSTAAAGDRQPATILASHKVLYACQLLPL